jgi:hypothetical protein
MNPILRSLTLLAAATSLLAWACLAGTSDVYRLVTSIEGSVQSGVTSNAVISDVKITPDDLINLGLGRPLGTPIGKDETLAAIQDYESEVVSVIVYDKNLGTRLATLGVLERNLTIEGFKKDDRLRRVIGDLVILPTGDGTNGLTGGTLHMSALLDINKEGRFTKLKADLLGILGTTFFQSNIFVTATNVIDGTITNTVLVTNLVCCTTNIDVAVSRAKFNSGGKLLGILVEDEPQP